MATKAAYLTALVGESYILGVDTPVEDTEESNGNLDWTVYDVELTEVDSSGNGILIKHRFVVYGEGGGSENVLNEYVPWYKENLSGYSALVTEIESIADLKSYWIRNISTEQQFAIVRAMIEGTGIDVVWYLIYNDGGLQQAVINNPEDF